MERLHFTQESVKEAMKYNIDNDVPIGLLKAVDLKNIADDYSKKSNEEPFPLANFIQTGVINKDNFVY